MKVALILVCVAVALPTISQAFLFGVTLTDAAGLTLAAANPAQTGVIITVGVLGAALAFAAGSLLAQAPGFQNPELLGIPLNRKDVAKFLGFKRRGKRDAKQDVADIDGVFDSIFGDIHKSNIEGCFQRLVCDIAARPANYQKHVPIVKGLELMQTHALTSDASSVSRKLYEAVRFGQNSSDDVACEMTFNNCHWSGPQMNQVMEKFDNQVTIEA